jgi:predicted helicase
MTDCVSDLHVLESGTQCFPLYYYEVIERDQLGLFDSYEDEYVRHDAISDFVLKQAQALYGPKCAKEDIFYYIYGFLHSKDYRHRFAADLVKMLPRIPLCENVKTFKSFSAAGRELALLHTNYETAEKWTDAIVSGADTSFTIGKIRWAKNNSEDDKRTIVLAPGVRIENIPLQAYEYSINGKSAIEWLMERYQYTVNQDSQISNNPNAWGIEHNQPHYILDLLLRVIAVSMKTVQLVAKLPEVDFSNPS